MTGLEPAAASKGTRQATAFYRDRQAEMDAGAQVAWPARFDAKTEISAIQHAMDLRLQVGEEAFAGEYQNEPVNEQISDDRLTVEQVTEKVNGRPRHEVPLAATKLTLFIDVHDRLLFYCVCAWQEDFTGYVVDYGTFPDQRRPFFTMADARRTLGRASPGMGADGAIQAGLEQPVSSFLAKSFKRDLGELPAGQRARATGTDDAAALPDAPGSRRSGADDAARLGGAVRLPAMPWRATRRHRPGKRFWRGPTTNVASRRGPKSAWRLAWRFRVHRRALIGTA